MIRLGKPEDAERVNALRRQVNDLHVQGRPDLFKPGFGPELQAHVMPYLNGENGYAAVEERDGRIVGMVMADYIDRPEGPYSYARRYVQVAEICVDSACRGQGIGAALLDYVKKTPGKKAFPGWNWTYGILTTRWASMKRRASGCTGGIWNLRWNEAQSG